MLSLAKFQFNNVKVIFSPGFKFSLLQLRFIAILAFRELN